MSYYSNLLREGIESSDLSLAQISRSLLRNGIELDRTIISRLQNDRYRPVNDEINAALAEMLGIDKLKFRVVAFEHVLPTDVFQHLIKVVGIEKEVS